VFIGVSNQLGAKQGEIDQVEMELADTTGGSGGDDAQPDMRLQRHVRRLNIHREKLLTEQATLSRELADLEVSCLATSCLRFGCGADLAGHILCVFLSPQ
jgi:hypothetical protein